jgi:threonine dehydrogenase-like Zn-dependent dehydrogenase
VTPGNSGSVRITDAPKPSPTSSQALLRVHKIGIDGTDLEINEGLYGEAPPGSDYLICGHECLTTVESVSSNSRGIQTGDLVVPTVRRPDDCINCRAGESDMCLTCNYREHGIKGLHGFCSEYTTTDANFLVKIPDELSGVAVLLEPMSVAEKAILQSLKIQDRMIWKPSQALVLGTGPLGLLTVMLARIKGFDVTAVATRPRNSLKAEIVQKIGATYVNSNEQPISSLGKFDLILEETGAASVATQAWNLLNPNGVLCLLGIYSPTQVTQDIGRILSTIVLGNKIVFGSVNANIRYFEQGLADFSTIQQQYPGALESLFTKVVPPSEFLQAYNPSRDDIKSVIDFQPLS